VFCTTCIRAANWLLLLVKKRLNTKNFSLRVAVLSFSDSGALNPSRCCPSLLLPSSCHRRRASPRHNPDGPLGWWRQDVSLPMAVVQWSSSVGCTGVSLFMGLMAAAGRSVVPPRRSSYSVDDSRLLWSGGASAAVGGSSMTAVAGGRSSRLPQGRSGEPLAWKSWAARGGTFPTAVRGAGLFSVRRPPWWGRWRAKGWRGGSS
jgi:hypothetical protein